MYLIKKKIMCYEKKYPSFIKGEILMAKAKRYSDDKVLAAQKKLRGLAVKQAGRTRSEVVDFLAADIRKAVQQGYSLKDIQALLLEAGISVSLARMQAMLNGQDEKSDDTVTPANEGVPRVLAEEARSVTNSSHASANGFFRERR